MHPGRLRISLQNSFVPFFQLMIEAVCGNGANGDIALDDFSMMNKNCSEIKNGTDYLTKF